MAIEIRPITEGEIPAFRRHLVQGFGADLRKNDDEGHERFAALMPLERTRAAYEGGQIVGTLGDFPLALTVPGGVDVAMAGTTMITVSATHRRRGVLTAMLSDHLQAAREADGPLAGLWASESVIYGRFGYGAATYRYVTEMDAKAITMTDPEMHGSLTMIDMESARAELPPIFDRSRAVTPGMLGRTEAMWRWRIFHDPSRDRGGSSALRFVLHHGPDGVDGYVVYRQRDKWEDFHSVGTVKVRELVALSDEAHTDLWRYLTNIDLFPTVEYWNLPVDDELPFRVTDPRRVSRSIWDALWLNVLDIPKAMSARTYGADGRLLFGVTENHFADADGTYELSVEGGAATCRPSSADPEITLTAQALGAAYLGGQPLGPLVSAGLVDATSEAAAKADRFLRGSRMPWCQEVF